jgi:hypothetical protein
MPQIENHETEQFDSSNNSQSNKMVWYFNECSSCKQQNNNSICKTQSNESLLTLHDESSRTSTTSERDDDVKVKPSSLTKIAVNSSTNKPSNVEKRELKDDKASSLNLPSAKFFKRDTNKVNIFKFF